LALAISAFISTSDFLMKAQMFSAMTRGVFAKLKSYLPSLRGLAASSVKGKLKASQPHFGRLHVIPRASLRSVHLL
jgi:hypothetical protein